jgi:phosphoribosyl 1,2-cyclic phosphate phosphodiesterase
MILTILGCGTSTGVPLISCKCSVCSSRNPKNHRLRASAWVQKKGKSILIDTSTDLRQQALRAKIQRIDAVLYTHPHADHIHGIDELRSYNFIQRSSIPVYGNSWTCDELRHKFNYIFAPGPVEGGGIPQLELHQLDSQAESVDIQGVSVTSISLQHGSKECLGYRIDSVAYVTDCSYIPSLSIERLKGLSVLILDCLRLQPHGTHFHLEQALEMISVLRPKKTFLTHLGHDFDYVKWNRKLPRGVSLAYDGLKIKTE